MKSNAIYNNACREGRNGKYVKARENERNVTELVKYLISPKSEENELAKLCPRAKVVSQRRMRIYMEIEIRRHQNAINKDNEEMPSTR